MAPRDGHGARLWRGRKRILLPDRRQGGPEPGGRTDAQSRGERPRQTLQCPAGMGPGHRVTNPGSHQGRFL
eukprot:7432914-Pyramimonas_sp.AAC.1